MQAAEEFADKDMRSNESRREMISSGLEEAIEEAERVGYIDAVEAKRRVRDLLASRKRQNCIE